MNQTKNIAKAISIDDYQVASKLVDIFLEQQNNSAYQKQQEKYYLITLGIQST